MRFFPYLVGGAIKIHIEYDRNLQYGKLGTSWNVCFLLSDTHHQDIYIIIILPYIHNNIS